MNLRRLLCVSVGVLGLLGVSGNGHARPSWIEQIQCAAAPYLPVIEQIAENVRTVLPKSTYRYRIDRMAEGETNLAKLITTTDGHLLYEQIYIDFPRARINVAFDEFAMTIIPEMSKFPTQINTTYHHISLMMQRKLKMNGHTCAELLHNAYAYLTQTFDFDAMKDVRTLASTSALGLAKEDLQLSISVPGEIERRIEQCGDGLCARVNYVAEVLVPDADGAYDESQKRRYQVERSLRFYYPDGHYKYEVIHIKEL